MLDDVPATATKRKQSTDNQPKKRGRTACKWCKSTSHLTKKSLQCPYNQKHESSTPSIATSTTVTPVSVTLLTTATTVTPSPPLAATESTTTSTPPLPTRHTQKFQIGDNVNAMWKKKQWYHGHVTGFKNNRYDIYFPCDGTCKSNVRPEHVRAKCTSVSLHTRRDMLDKVFYYDEDNDLNPGQWKVRRIVGNEFVCTRLTGDGCNQENFDIGYVMRMIQADNERVRQS